MGITAVVGKDDSIGTLDFAAEIIKPGIYDPEMRDEIYLQLMKQMTDNPAKLSRAKGVILLALVCGCFNPSDALLPIVKTFIDDGQSGLERRGRGAPACARHRCPPPGLLASPSSFPFLAACAPRFAV